MTQAEFYSLPAVQAQIEIQKRNPFGSQAHRNAWTEIKRLMSDMCGQAHADKYMPYYD